VLAYYLACLKDYQSVRRQLHLQNKPLCLQPDLQIRKLAASTPLPYTTHRTLREYGSAGFGVDYNRDHNTRLQYRQNIYLNTEQDKEICM
jgi:hypothetical protein